METLFEVFHPVLQAVLSNLQYYPRVRFQNNFAEASIRQPMVNWAASLTIGEKVRERISRKPEQRRT